MEKDQNMYGEKEKAPSRIVWRVLILGAVLIILIVLSIGIVKLVPKAISSLASVNISFSSLFTPKEKITVTSDKSRINSGESFNISISHTGGKVEGYFNLSTACQNTYRVEYQLGSTRRAVDCKNIARLDASTTSFALFGINSGADNVTVPVTVDFVSQSDSKIQAGGETTVVINAPGGASNSNVNPPSYSTSTTRGGTTPSPSYPVGGVADLVVRITAVSNNNPRTTDRVSVSFEVQNIGTAPSGPWDLRVAMPAQNVADQTKFLSNNASIPPGLAIGGSLYVDQLQAGNNKLIQLSIDPNNRLTELRKDNNSAEATVNVSGSNNSGGSGGVSVVSSGVDLVVKILDTGIVNSRGQYTATSRIRSGDEAAVRFQIANQGERSSGSFEYRVEINDADIEDEYDSPSLSSGQARIYVASFEDLSRSDDNTVEITVDPSDDVNESRENNNSDSDDLNID